MDPTDVNTFDMMDRQNQAFAPEMDAQNAEDQMMRDQEAADADHKREIEKMKAAPKPKPSSSSK
jgi:hypothetical protein